MKQKFFGFVMLFSLVLGVITANADPYAEFEDLYPGCDDNQASKIYEPDAWPPGFRPPLFPGGGDIMFIRYIFNKLNEDYPDVVDSTAPSNVPGEPDKVYRAKGTVMVHLTIDRCGKAVNPVIKKGLNEEYNKAALKVFEDLPIFQPAALNGQRVKCGLLVPVRFIRETLPVKHESWDEGDQYYYDDSSNNYGGDW